MFDFDDLLEDVKGVILWILLTMQAFLAYDIFVSPLKNVLGKYDYPFKIALLVVLVVLTAKLFHRKPVFISS